ncbi:hypothetical protein Tco_1556715 [Tanacetum coccineum]
MMNIHTHPIFFDHKIELGFRKRAMAIDHCLQNHPPSPKIQSADQQDMLLCGRKHNWIYLVIPREKKIELRKGDEEAASEVASPEMIPWGLLLDLRKELELRKRLETNENGNETRVRWEVAQCMIKETIRNCKRTKELPPRHNLSNLVAIDPRIVKKNHPKRSQTGLESHDHVKRPRCCAPWDPNHKFPKTTNVPLNDEEKIIWKEFKEFDKDNPGLSGISSLTLDKDRKPIDVANPIVSLISSYAVAAFNEAIEKYVKKDEHKNIYDVQVKECKYIKATNAYYYFTVTIEAFEERKLGVYEAKVRLKIDDGSKTLGKFFLTDRKPLDGWIHHPDRNRHSGMQCRRKNVACRGYDFRNPSVLSSKRQGSGDEYSQVMNDSGLGD